MAIEKIVLKCIRGSETLSFPPPLELGPSQGALIPNVGDKYMAASFSMKVTERKFEVDGDTMYVFLVG
jgi:hypothetical protein